MRLSGNATLCDFKLIVYIYMVLSNVSTCVYSYL